MPRLDARRIIMQRLAVVLLAVIFVSALGCGSEDVTDVNDLSGLVTVEFAEQQYEFSLSEAANGVEFEYTVSIAEDIPGMIPRPQDMGKAAGPGLTGMYPFVKIYGAGNSYSLADVGLAAPREREPTVIAAGVYPLSFGWKGRNWDGPSDWGQPYGAPFPPGTYSVTVSMIGERMTADGPVAYRIQKTVSLVLKK
jgi:hypothetical protein